MTSAFTEARENPANKRSILSNGPAKAVMGKAEFTMLEATGLSRRQALAYQRVAGSTGQLVGCVAPSLALLSDRKATILPT
jgi:hypothetical protein